VGLGLSQRAAVLVLYGIGALLGLAAMALSTATVAEGTRIGLALGAVALAAFVFLEIAYIRRKRHP